MICSVTLYHHRPCYRKGDKEDETVIKSVNRFKTKKEANTYILSEIKRNYDKYKSKKVKDGYYIYTGKHWVNENTGEEHEETYLFKIEKWIK